MSNAKNRWNNGRINSTRPDGAALRARAGVRLRSEFVWGFTADAAEAIANVNTDTDDDGWSYVVMPMAEATARGFVPRNDGRWCVMVMDDAGEVLGFM